VIEMSRRPAPCSWRPPRLLHVLHLRETSPCRNSSAMYWGRCRCQLTVPVSASSFRVVARRPPPASGGYAGRQPLRPAEVPSDVRRASDAVRRGRLQLLSLLNDILDLAKLEPAASGTSSRRSHPRLTGQTSVTVIRRSARRGRPASASCARVGRPADLRDSWSSPDDAGHAGVADTALDRPLATGAGRDASPPSSPN